MVFKVKRISSYDVHLHEPIQVAEICEYTKEEQAEIIADKFSHISNEYDALKQSDIQVPLFSEKSIPHISQAKVKLTLEQMKTKPSTVPGDIPAQILKHLAKQVSVPLTSIINACIVNGEWPDAWKEEAVTPIPKVHPPLEMSDLRNISGLRNLNKVTEKILAELMLADMKENLDKSQYGNTKGVSIQHYLVKFIDKVLVSLDCNSKGEIFAALATMIDWKEAFNQQDPKLGILSFIKNGVRPSLIPTLISYFQNRSMFVKWQGVKSKPRTLNGGGPQGGTFGIFEYLSQSNTNANCVNSELRWKWVDDLTILEIINLVNIGMSCFNVKNEVPNDINVNKNFIHKSELLTDNNLREINNWTSNQKMKLNKKKTNYMIFNFTEKYQFSTRLDLDGDTIQEKENIKLLGTTITNDLKWEENTKNLVKKGNSRMCLLRAVSNFNPPLEDLRKIYIQYIRSILEQSCVVWHSSLTQEDAENIERVQKNALRVILKSNYKDYENALEKLNLETLQERRENLCLSFAKKCLKIPQACKIFKEKTKIHTMDLRSTEKYNENVSNTKRYQSSAVPYMQRLLNKHHKEKQSLQN